MSDLIDPVRGPQVSPLPRFKTRDEQGNIVASHPAIPVRKAAEKKYYVCSLKSASMHNFDGKKIPFVDGFLATDLVGDQNYLDNEIAEGNPYIGYATEDQINHAMMKADPVGTIKEKLRPQIEAELRAELEAKIRAEIAGERKDVKEDGAKIAGVDAGKGQSALDTLNSMTGNGTGAKITPVSTAAIAGAAKQN